MGAGGVAKTDFELYGVVGGRTSIVLFLDIYFAFVVERFYAINVGVAGRSGNM